MLLSGSVTGRSYFSAACANRTAYEQRIALFGGSHVAGLESP